MPYIISRMWWPSDKTSEVVNKAFEVAPDFPPDPSISTQVVMNAVRATEKGVMNISIDEAKPGKLEEAIERASRNMVNYHDIVGFEYSIEVWNTAVEAFGLIGRKPPE
jgi:hypothetical protein